MMTLKPFERILKWASDHERPLGAVLFVFGFITDVFTFGLLPISVVNIFFATYVLLAAVTTFGTHLISAFHANDAWWRKLLSVLFPLGAQYALGGILSGFLVFYASHSVIAVSWPFLLLVFAVYGGNEYFRKHREHLVFQTVLFFFSLYAYCIFLLPLLTHSLGPWIFLGSTLLAAFCFALFLFLLKLANAPRYKESRPLIIGWSILILASIGASYFTGLIPPLPLVASHVDVYQQLTHTGSSYTLGTDSTRAWWDPFPRTLAHVPGTPLYAFSAVVAPVDFSTTEVHRWERYDETEKEWITVNAISFPIQGGRAGGYRGYSVEQNPSAGKWRLSIETKDGQVISRIAFTVVDAEKVDITRQDTF